MILLFFDNSGSVTDLAGGLKTFYGLFYEGFCDSRVSIEAHMVVHFGR